MNKMNNLVLQVSVFAPHSANQERLFIRFFLCIVQITEDPAVKKTTTNQSHPKMKEKNKASEKNSKYETTKMLVVIFLMLQLLMKIRIIEMLMVIIYYRYHLLRTSAKYC